MRYLLNIITFIILATTPLFSQESGGYVSPVDIPVALAANFGEVRSTHFHSGIDIKTEGVIGKRILSVADGYISRIAVSPTGYGRVLYISHPTKSTMSVYAHLDRFNDDIKKYVEEYQYRNKRYNIDIYPPKDMFKVKAGEFVAYSGNSGSSMAPHLHFEMRSLKSGNTLDPLDVCKFKVKDTTAPKLFSISVVDVESRYGVPIFKLGRRYKLIGGGNNYRVEGDTITLKRDSYLVIETIEAKDNSANIYGTRKMELYRANELFWGYDIPYISFATGRSIWSFTHYPKIVKNRNDFIRTYISDVNRLPYYKGSSKDGILRRHNHLTDANYKLVVSDEFDNSAVVNFVVSSTKSAVEPLPKPTGYMVMANEAYTYNSPKSKIVFARNSLQQSSFIDIETKNDMSFTFPTVVEVAPTMNPFNHGVKLSIKPESNKSINKSKLLIGYINEPSGRITSLGGAYKDGFVTASIYGSGSYVVVADTIAPKVVPLSPPAEPTRVLKFEISDDLSGIRSYTGWINDKWALFEYDAKNDLLSCRLNDEIAMKGMDNICVIIVIDKKGNKTTYKTRFIW